MLQHLFNIRLNRVVSFDIKLCHFPQFSRVADYQAELAFDREWMNEVQSSGNANLADVFNGVQFFLFYLRIQMQVKLLD